MILEAGSRATLGLVRVRLWRALLTSCVGSSMKCLDDMVKVLVADEFSRKYGPGV